MGGGGGRGLSNEYSCGHGAYLIFGDLTPYLTYIKTITIEKNTPVRQNKENIDWKNKPEVIVNELWNGWP
jgi:hypothetical protein